MRDPSCKKSQGEQLLRTRSYVVDLLHALRSGRQKTHKILLFGIVEPSIGTGQNEQSRGRLRGQRLGSSGTNASDVVFAWVEHEQLMHLFVCLDNPMNTIVGMRRCWRRST